MAATPRPRCSFTSAPTPWTWAQAQDVRSSAEGGAIPPTGPVAFGWVASDLNPHGVVGEAHLARAEKGRLLAERYVADVIGLLGRVADQDISGPHSVEA